MKYTISLREKLSGMNKIVGLGNALVDVLAVLEDDSLLAEVQLERGCMTLIDKERYHRISRILSCMSTHLSTGGSAGNMIRALAHLGIPTKFIGKINAGDDYGRFFRESLVANGTEASLLTTDALPTGVASTFVSPGGERTFGTYLGAGGTLAAAELTPALFADGSLLFVEGYLVQDHELIMRAVQMAKACGLQVCLDLASRNIVEADRAFFDTLLSEYVDIVFANAEEARAFTGCESSEAVEALGHVCSIAVVKEGARGAWACGRGGKCHVDALPVPQVTDTTGAGDFFAAGFIYGLQQGYALEHCMRAGTLLSGHVVQVMGTELPEEQWLRIKADVASEQEIQKTQL